MALLDVLIVFIHFWFFGDPHQETLWIHTLPLGKALFVSVHLFTCVIFCVRVCVLLVLTANFIKTEVVSWKYLHNTQLEETPRAV